MNDATKYVVAHITLLGAWILALIGEVIFLATAVHFDATIRVVEPVVTAGLACMGVATWTIRTPGYMLGGRNRRKKFVPFMLMSIAPLLAGVILWWGSIRPINGSCYRHNVFIQAFEPCMDESYYAWRSLLGFICLGLGATLVIRAFASAFPQLKMLVIAVAVVVGFILLFMHFGHDAPNGPVVVRPLNKAAVTSLSPTAHHRAAKAHKPTSHQTTHRGG